MLVWDKDSEKFEELEIEDDFLCDIESVILKLLLKFLNSLNILGFSFISVGLCVEVFTGLFCFSLSFIKLEMLFKFLYPGDIVGASSSDK